MKGHADDKEYNLKAAFIYNFTRFTEWGRFSNGNEFIIGVIGSSPIKAALEDIAKAKTVNSNILHKKYEIVIFFLFQEIVKSL